MDLEELKCARDHTDDVTHEMAFDILIDDMRRRGVMFDVPSDPMTDKVFIALLNDEYGIDQPLYMPPEPEASAAA